MQWLKLPAWKVGDRGFEPPSRLQVSKKRNVYSPLTRKDAILWGAYSCDREVECSASDRQGSNFESCVRRAVSSHSSHHPQWVLLAQVSLYVHKFIVTFIVSVRFSRQDTCGSAHVAYLLNIIVKADTVIFYLSRFPFV